MQTFSHLCLISCLLGWTSFEAGEVFYENQLALMDALSLPHHVHSSQQIHEEAKVSPLEV